METRSISARPDVALASTTPRVTPTPPRASRFGEVLSNTVVRSAESAMRVLPGSPMMAVAVRGATGPGGTLPVPMSTMSSAQGPGATAGRAGVGNTIANAAGGIPSVAVPPAGGAAVGGEAGSIEASLQQSQDMNLYSLQVQESVNAQNRSFTTLSNVLKAQHDTVKTAIGNIR